MPGVLLKGKIGLGHRPIERESGQEKGLGPNPPSSLRGAASVPTLPSALPSVLWPGLRMAWEAPEGPLIPEWGVEVHFQDTLCLHGFPRGPDKRPQPGGSDNRGALCLLFFETGSYRGILFVF